MKKFDTFFYSLIIFLLILSIAFNTYTGDYRVASWQAMTALWIIVAWVRKIELEKFSE
jgi:uncharacterized membrane protein